MRNTVTVIFLQCHRFHSGGDDSLASADGTGQVGVWKLFHEAVERISIKRVLFLTLGDMQGEATPQCRAVLR